MEKLRLIKRSLLQVKRNIPIHFQIGNMGNPDHVADVLHRVRHFFNFKASMIYLFIMHFYK